MCPCKSQKNLQEGSNFITQETAPKTGLSIERNS